MITRVSNWMSIFGLWLVVSVGSARSSERLEKNLAQCGVHFEKQKEGGKWRYNISFSGKSVSNAALEAVRQLSTSEMVVMLDLGYSGISDAQIGLLSGLLDLEILVLYGTNVTDSGMSKIRSLPKLRKLFIGPTKIGADGLGFLVDAKNLEHFEIKSPATCDKLAALFFGKKKLKHLSLHGSKGISDAGIASLRDLPELESLEFSETKITEAGLANLGQLNKLNELGLDGADITGDGFGRFRGFFKLKSLSVGKTRLTKVGIDNISIAFPNLETLYLCDNLLNGNDLKSLENMASIKTFFGMRTPMSDEVFGYLRNCPLETLCLSFSKVTGAGINKLKIPASLCTLILEGCPVLDEHIKNLDRFQNLKYLKCSETKISEKSLVTFAKIKGLRSLYLGGTEVLSRGLIEFKGHPGLTNLEIERIEPEHIELLQGIPHLRFLSVSKQRMSKSEMSMLQQKLPNITVAWHF